MIQIFQRPLRDVRDNTDGIRSDVHQIKEDVNNLNSILTDLPKQIKSELIVEEKVVHDAYVTGGIELGTLGLVVGLILGLFTAGALKK